MKMEKEGMVVKGRVTIDTRPPFRSVKEAVAMFGERVLVGEIYAKQLKEKKTNAKLQKEEATIALGTVTVELEETKQNLNKAREEGNNMANWLKSLRDELEQTKRELRQLKAAKEVVGMEHPKAAGINPEIELEELKFVENAMSNRHNNINQNIIHQPEFHRKKFVSFASPPSLTREIVDHSQGDDVGAAASLGRTPSFRKGGKKKPLIPIVGWFFPRKKRDYQAAAGDRSPKA